MTEQEELAEVHRLRMAAHWGKSYDAFAEGRWPRTPAEWRQTPHGAPWDSNVEMARFHLKLAKAIHERLGRDW